MSRKPPRYDVPKAAPQPLRLVQDLVNTADFENRVEFLPDVKTLTGWLEVRGLPGARAVTPEDLERTHALREALRALLVANAGHDLDPRAVTELNRASDAAGVGLHFSLDGSAKLEPTTAGVPAAHGLLLALVHRAMTEGTWSRLKACRTCSWAFYDYSKNRSATWCSMQLCGNRRKTRAYRARRRSAT